MPIRYAAVADLAARLPAHVLVQLADDGLTGVADPTVLAACVESAADEVDLYLSARYRCPLSSPWPGPIRTLTVDIASWHLHKRIGAVSEAVRLQYEDAIARLRDLGSGRASLGIDPPAEAASYAVAEVSSSTRILDRAKLEGW